MSSEFPLRVACVGGGPGGLFAAISLALRFPGAHVDVFERNRASDVFGFGVVFSDATLDNVDAVDPVLRNALAAHGRHWDRIDVRTRGEVLSAGGNGMSAIHRRLLLDAMRDRAQELGARLHYSAHVDAADLAKSGVYDLIVAADGTNSATRELFLEKVGHTVDEAAVKFIWFGTTYRFDGLTFLHKQSKFGNFAVHAYPIGADLSTFIVETDEQTWRRAGLDGFDMSTPPGSSDEVTQRFLEGLFSSEIDGHPLVANNSRWANFRTRRSRKWHFAIADVPIVLLGDAVHTAHFSVGSGTKMAMEDAAALADSIARQPQNIPAAIADFEETRRPQVDRIQDAAVPSLSWWDHFAEYDQTLSPWQFGFHFFSRVISEEKIRDRDPEYQNSVERAWFREHRANPLDTPLRVGDVTLAGRHLDLVDESANTLRLVHGTDGITAYRNAAPGLPLLFEAPEVTATSLPTETIVRLEEALTAAPTAVVVSGGSSIARVLVSEYVRLRHQIPSIVIDAPTAIRDRRAVGRRDNAATLVLAGRADAVAYAPAVDSNQSDNSNEFSEARR